MAEPPQDADPARRDGAIALAIAALVVATVAIGALATSPSGPRPVAASPEADPACQEWSDGCRVCQRLPDGPACSLPGIACTTGASTCLRTEP